MPGLPGDGYDVTTIGKTLYTQVLERLQQRHTSVTALGNDTHAWERRQAHVRSSIQAMFAPMPPAGREPPRFVVTGTMQGGGYTVQRVLIETRPGQWVPAGLWMPDVASGGVPVPAVLAPSGHDGERTLCGAC